MQRQSPRLSQFVPYNQKFLNCGVHACDLKSFGEEAQGLDGIKPFNVLVGRNNAGKSSLLDVVEIGCSGAAAPDPIKRRNRDGQVLFTTQLNSAQVASGLRVDQITDLRINDFDRFARTFDGVAFRRNAIQTNAFGAAVVGKNSAGVDPFQEFSQATRDSLITSIARRCSNPFQGVTFRRLAAERDVRPENPSQFTEIDRSGAGATSFIQRILVNDNLDSSLVEVDLLRALNTVCKPDFVFSRILCQLNAPTGTWEIFLEEANKGAIRLSQSGSGLKTILLALLMLLVEPKLKRTSVETTFFAFEELENNLHPALLRRLLQYLREFAEKFGTIFFLTTHSNVVVDVFSRDPEAQILHVQHNGESCTVSPVGGYLRHKEVLDDLDIRASDILQSNGVIWVEGPSDRTYINKWISLWSNGALYEGNHYQIVFYGGRLLSHLSSEVPEEVAGAISLLRVNRNLALIMDSDRTAKKLWTSATKRRVQSEIVANGGFVWMTKGREIENYLSDELITATLGDEKLPPLGQYDHFFTDFAPKLPAKLRKHLGTQKVKVAEIFCQTMTKQMLTQRLDLDDQMESLCNRIRGWNKLS